MLSQCPQTEPPMLLQPWGPCHAPVRNIPKCMAPGDTCHGYRGEQGSLSCHPPAVHQPVAKTHDMKPLSSKPVVRGAAWREHTQFVSALLSLYFSIVQQKEK